VIVLIALGFPALALRVSPFDTSQNSIDLALYSASSDPSSTIPKPPLVALPQPVPPPLWIETQVAPLIASPITFCIAISAVTADPSYMFDVSLKGASVPETSWWSLPITIGDLIYPSLIALFILTAHSILPSVSEYKILAYDPTVNLFLLASLIQFILFMIYWWISGSASVNYSSRTLNAI